MHSNRYMLGSGLIVVVCLAIYSLCSAQQPTHSKEEMQRFNEAQKGLSQKAEDYWNGIVALEQFLADYPNTFLKGDTLVKLLFYYSKVTDDPVLLGNLSERVIDVQMHSDNAYELTARAFVDNEIPSGQALFYATKAYEGAQKKHAEWGKYELGLFRRQQLLAKAYHLAGQPKRAIEEMQKCVQLVRQTDNPRWFQTLAAKQATVDRARVELLRLYVEQGNWTKAYPLAAELMQKSVVRDGVGELWSRAYVGKFGSGKGMTKMYASLKAEWDNQVVAQVEKERISRPGPAFTVQKLDGEVITSADLKGKAVVVTFWAGWCSPCIEELPYLQKLKTQFRKQRVEFLAVNIDKDSGMRRDMVASFRYQKAPYLMFALGDLEMRKAFGSEEIPYTCIIDPEGQIRYERKGMGADFSTAMAHQLKWITSMHNAQ